MTWRLALKPQADRDINKHFEYIANVNLEAAIRFYEAAFHQLLFRSAHSHKATLANLNIVTRLTRSYVNSVLRLKITTFVIERYPAASYQVARLVLGGSKPKFDQQMR